MNSFARGQRQLRLLWAKRRRKTPTVELVKTYGTTLRHNALPIKSTKTDYVKNLQLWNGTLDIFLKFGALSVIFGAVIVHRYLDSLGAKSLFPHLIGSQAGLSSIIFGLGLVLFVVSLTLASSPWALRFARNFLANDNMDELFKRHRIFFLLVSAQISFIVLALCDASAVTFVLSPLMSVGALYFGVPRRFARRPQIVYLLGATAGQIFSVYPWVFLIGIIQSISLPEIKSVNGDSVRLIIFVAWVLFYSAIVAIYVKYKKSDDKESASSYAVSLLVPCSILLFMLAAVSPKFFIDSAMSASSMRQVQKESQWWSINTAAVEASAPDVLPDVFKKYGASTYFCGYSPMLYTERVMLCPATVTEPSMKNCYLFQGSQVMPTSKAPSKEGQCAAPTKP